MTLERMAITYVGSSYISIVGAQRQHLSNFIVVDTYGDDHGQIERGKNLGLYFRHSKQRGPFCLNLNYTVGRIHGRAIENIV